MRGRVVYDPEQFTRLVYRMDNPKAVLLIYSNGRICVSKPEKRRTRIMRFSTSSRSNLLVSLDIRVTCLLLRACIIIY